MSDLISPFGYHLSPKAKEMLRQRYDEHAEEYATDVQRDGVPLNGCWTADTVKDIEEELVDAIFNSLVLYKKTNEYRVVDEGATDRFVRKICSLWDDLQLLREDIKKLEVSS